MKNLRQASLRLCACAALLASAAALQGCFPVIVGGAAATAFAVSDRRQPEVILGDKRIEYTASNRIGDVWGGRGAHINISSYNYTVLLTGEAPTPEAKAEIEKIASEVPQVKNVVNEVEVAGKTSGTSRSSDTIITGKVKGNLLSDAKGRYEPDQVKVVTERAVVYLMGLVTRQEAEDITEVARTTSGVLKVVRVFEYIQPPAKP